MEHLKFETNDLKARIRQAEEVKITPGTAFFVDKDSGSFVGPTAEGTMGIIIYAGLAKTIDEDSLNNAQAIRIPRLLQSDELLNFHIAEISFHEGLQSLKAVDMPGLGGAKFDLRPDRPNQYATIPGGDDSPCYVGFYLSPSTDYRLALVSENQAWPKEFAQYLSRIGYQPKTLYQEITDHIARTRKAGEYASLETVLYLPSACESLQVVETDNPKNATRSDHKITAPLRYLGRSQIEDAYKRKDIGGWWFNLPMYLYSWMTADLERLLTGILDDDVAGNEAAEFAQLARWQPKNWLWLCRTLALGLGGLHSKGLIHGDPRPANIMARLSENDDLQPDHFRWIDVGLGYGQTQHNAKTDAADSAPAPPPLGGGRVTPFYAPERVESVEFEDADQIHLTKQEDGYYKLQFFWRRRTYEDPIPLLLRENDKPLRELGKLRRGDRIQLREFIFDVEQVEDDHILISKLYELVLDRVLIEHRNGDSEDTITSRLQNVAISRYRLFKQWSQATDIFGLGIMVLYVFFIRGLYTRNAFSSSSESGGTTQNLTLEKSTRERIFQELTSLMRSQSFLNGVMTAIKDRGKYKTRDELWQKDVLLPLPPGYDRQSVATKEHPSHPERIQQIVDHVLTMDANITTVLWGVNGNNGLFVLLIYFCLCCVWRKDEIHELLPEEFSFDPYCDSRLMLVDKEQAAGPAKHARQDLEKLCELINAAQIDDQEIPSIIDESELTFRDDQMITAIERAQRLSSEIEEKKELLKRYEADSKKQQETSTGLQAKLDSLRANYNEQNLEAKNEKRQRLDLEMQLQSSEETREKHELLLQELQTLVDEFTKSSKEQEQTIQDERRRRIMLEAQVKELSKGLFQRMFK